MAISDFAADGLAQVADQLNLGYAFGAGMISAANPCGFAMLPIYLSLFLGLNNKDYKQQSFAFRGFNAAKVSLVMSLGFTLLFLSIGLSLSWVGDTLLDAGGWMGFTVGIALFGLGLMVAFGKKVSVPWLQSISGKLGDPSKGGMKNYFLFGLGFGMASMSCTFPIFLTVIGGALSAETFAESFAGFLYYSLGMTSVILTLTLIIAWTGPLKGGGPIRKLMPHFNKITAMLLLVSGAYIMTYWGKEIF